MAEHDVATLPGVAASEPPASDPPARPEFLTLEEAAALLRTTPRTLRTWTKAGKVPVVEGLGHRLLYRTDQLLRIGLPPE